MLMATADRLTHEEDRSKGGGIEACKRCSGLICCGIIENGGILEPPFLCQYDMEQIECVTGLRRDQFATQQLNPVTNNLIHTMKTIPQQGCIFFDRKSGKCEIHSFRPIDCRLFPLDVEYVDDQHYWALFMYDRCNVQRHDLDGLMEFRHAFVQLIGNELHDYATQPVPGMRTIGYRIIMPVNSERATHG